MNENKLNMFAPLGVGLDQLFDRLETGLKEGTSYPPHNVIKVSNDIYRLELAVSGFEKDEIAVTEHSGELSVTGTPKNKDKSEDVYLHRGIARRSFVKRFKLGEHVRVEGATFNNGILDIKLRREIPDELQPKTITIS
jgi:molecular chaperone IbpA